jgi:hypothetical protein
MINYPSRDLFLCLYDRATLVRTINYKYYQLKTLCVKFVLARLVYPWRMGSFDTPYISSRG